MVVKILSAETEVLEEDKGEGGMEKDKINGDVRKPQRCVIGLPVYCIIRVFASVS